ncbi:membrane protein insertion efficiency factor YidD [Agromyces intestinalis]|uniref:Putative membrane protein insertion efficiency factor n=1 Tax=Agromyces intestinalis TaxID=2592652 RepID=A0A5C1YHE7_9MICO|nr:membrane protein insertion efficiency factor YidD [Agromyces intestinalis]
MRDLALFVLLLPRNLGVLLLRGYRAVISPLYGDVCRYYPSCSAYGLGAVQQRGLVVGSALAAWRILRCNPWSRGGVDDVRPARHDRYRLTPFGWVLPAAWVTGSGASSDRTAHELHSHATGTRPVASRLSPVSSRKA